MSQSACSSKHLKAVGVPVRHMHSHVAVLDTIDTDSTMRLMIELVKALDRKKVNDLTVI
jgi:putative aminopeptidase FrvX